MVSFFSKNNIKPTVVYLSILAFISIWWSFAFIIFYRESSAKIVDVATVQVKKDSLSPDYISQLSRENIQKALSGNVSLMAKLIAEWNLDADILASRGLPNIKKLPKDKFLWSQVIERILSIESNSERTPMRLLPQTFIAASFLLSLSDPEEIVAIPSGLREQSSIYPKSITDRIKLDIDRYNSEAIYLAKPDVAFVAHYSHPSTIQALSNQGIPLFAEKPLYSITDIIDTIKRYGKVVNRSMKAELLTSFIEAAILTIDNRIQSHIKSGILPKILFLHYYSQFSLPTEKHITGQLIKRLKEQNFNFITLPSQNTQEWLVPINSEQIVNLDPDLLIVSTIGAKKLKDPLMKFLSPKKSKIIFIDDTFQAPNQYIVLAYLDLAQSLIENE